MKLAFTESFGVPPEALFAALTDPESLRACIEGCEKITLTGPDAYDVHMKIGIAGIKGSYTGRIEMQEKQPPESFVLAVEGKGAPGFLKGRGRIVLAAAGAGTELRCEGEAQVGGMIVAVGSRLIEAAARKIAGDFFGRLRARVEGGPKSA